MVDTETGSPAEQVYVKFGFTEIGTIPQFCISPAGGMKDETFYYKHLV